MSKGPSGTGGDYKLMKHLNLKISRKDWCAVPETLHCRIDQNHDQNLCLFCQFRKPLNIPRMLNDWEKENRNE